MRVVNKKLPMLAYCVAANCNNSQMTPGIIMHELPRNWPAVRQKWIKFIQFKWADFLAASHHAHLCREHFSESNFTNPMEYHMSKLTWCSGTLWKSCLTGSNWYPCGSLGQSISFVFGTRVGHFAENAFFSCIYNPQITVSPTSSLSASFNGNRVKNHP